MNRKGVKIIFKQRYEDKLAQKLEKPSYDKMRDAEWESRDPYIGTSLDRWESDLGFISLEDVSRLDTDYDLRMRYTSGRFNPLTIAEGLSSCMELKEEVLEN